MKKILLFTVALVCAATMWAQVMEGPWTQIAMKTHVRANDKTVTSMTFAGMNGSVWDGNITPMQDGDGVSYIYEGSSPDTSIMGIFSTYKDEIELPAYSYAKLTWKYQLSSKSTKHHSTTALYARTGAYDDITGLAVDFSNHHDTQAGAEYLLDYFTNEAQDGKTKKAEEKTTTFELDNRDGHAQRVDTCYLLLTHVVASADGRSGLKEWGAFKSISVDTVWTYRKIVSFDANGGTGAIVNQIIDNSGKLSPRVFTRAGYIFQGWATSPDGEVVYPDQAMITATAEDKGPVTLYAVWTEWGHGKQEGPLTQLEWNYSVRSTEDQDQNLKFSEMNGQQWPGTVSNIRYYDYIGLGFQYKGESPANSRMGIFSTFMNELAAPSYSYVKLTWTFELGSVSTKHHSATCMYGMMDSYSDMTNLNVDFTNHYTDKTGKDYLLLPAFVNEHQDGQGYLSDEKTITFDFDNRDGSEPQTKTRYIMLTHVMASSDGKTGLDEIGYFRTVTLDTVWSYRKIITFDANGGTGTMASLTFDDNATLPRNAFNREDYIFAGWALTPDGEVVYTDKAEMTATAEDKGPVTLYAIWKEWKQGKQEGPWTQLEWNSMACSTSRYASVSYEELDNTKWPGTITSWQDNDGLGFRYAGESPTSSKMGIFSTYRNDLVAPAYAYIKLDWTFQVGSVSTKHHSSTCLYGLMNAYDATKELEVDFSNHHDSQTGKDDLLLPAFVNQHQDGVAYYTANQTISFDFDNRNGRVEQTKTRYMMMTFVTASGDAKSGLYEWGAFKSISVDTTLVYRTIITFNANGGFGTMNDQTIDGEGTLRKNAFSRDGYSISGWALSPDGPVVYANQDSITVTEDNKGPVTLYAKWKPGTTYNVPIDYFDVNPHSADRVIKMYGNHSPEERFYINLYLYNAGPAGGSTLTPNKSYTWDDMNQSDCFYQLNDPGMYVTWIVDANLTYIVDEQNNEHLFGSCLDILGNTINFNYDVFPGSKGDTLTVTFPQSLKAEYDGQWHFSGDNQVYSFMLTPITQGDSWVGHYTEATIDTAATYLRKMRVKDGMLSIRQADIDITQGTDDTLKIDAYLAASNSNVYHVRAFYEAPKPLVQETIIAKNLYINTDNLYGISGVFQFEASTQNYAVNFALSASSEDADIYGTYTVGLKTGNSGFITDYSTAKPQRLEIYSATVTVLPTEFGTVITGTALCYNNIEYAFHLSYFVPAKTRTGNLDMRHLNLEPGIGTWRIAGFSEDSTQFISLEFNNSEIAGTYDIVHMSPNESYLMTDITWRNGKVDAYNYFQLIDANLTVGWDEQNAVAYVMGPILVRNNDDIPQFTVYLANEPSRPEGIEDVNADANAKAVKLLIDGQLFILRDGKVYTVQGVLVESRK